MNKTTYKQTEVGLIPNDWEVITLENLSTRIGDGIHSTPIYSSNGEYYFVNGNNLINGRIVISEETKRVSKEEYLLNKREINQTTVLLSINGTIGNIAFYNDEKIVLGKSAAYINLNDKIDKHLFYQLVQTQFIKKYFDDELTGSTIKNLGLGSIRNTPIPLPPTKAEQTAIATALSDADALISSLEKLIAKKRNIKQGAMQKLLQPKEGWEVKKLGEVCENIGSGKSKTQSQDGKFPIFGSTGIIGWCNTYDYYGHKILVARVGANAGTVNVVDGNYCVSDNTLMLSLKPEIDLNFIYSFLILFQLNKLVFGSGQPLITGGQLKNIEISLPKSKEEQNRIATILSDMDAEINALETKLEKYKKVKLGMMQNLLTGKIRLV
jgi:type I restriction enzyme S subunit